MEKSVAITGGTRGIGLAMALEFLGRGCCVTVSGRGESIPDQTLEALKAYQDRVQYVRCDVQCREDVGALWDLAAERWGRVDIWINNAGQNAPYEYVYDTDYESADAVIGTNIRGMVYGSQIAAARMREQGGGQIWNMEGLGSNGMIQPKTVLYGMSKCALSYFTRGLAKELSGTGVLAGRLSPGMMLTDFITKAPDGEASPVLKDESFKKVFNILADKPNTVAAFLVPRILKNTKNDAHIMWLTNRKAAWRFMTASMHRDKLI